MFHPLTRLPSSTPCSTALIAELALSTYWAIIQLRRRRPTAHARRRNRKVGDLVRYRKQYFTAPAPR